MTWNVKSIFIVMVFHKTKDLHQASVHFKQSALSFEQPGLGVLEPESAYSEASHFSKVAL